MPRSARLRLPCPNSASLRWKSSALAAALTLGAPAVYAQEANPPAPPADERGDEQDGAPIAFEADGVSYDDASDSVTAFGNVVMRRNGQSVRADKLVWNRKTGEVEASGSIRFVDNDGNQLFSDKLTLDDDLRAGAMENMLLALREGGRLAAASGQRAPDGTVVLSNAVYSACAVEDSEGCPVRPSWRITAERVIYDDAKKLIRFKGARLELFGARLLPLPGLMLASDGRPISGLLIPDVRLSASNGVEFSQTYYKRLGNNRDLAVTGYVYTEALPMVSAQYRQLTSTGAFQVTGYATRGSRIPIGVGGGGSQNDFRGYLGANGKLQFDPNWSLTVSGRLASDRTFLRRYDISRDDRLRSVIEAERIDENSYLSISGWATQTLRVADAQGQVPIALPVIDYRRRLSDPVLGGKVELQFNSLAITRTSGQDTQRAFASARWDLRRITSMGQEITLTALARGDVYNSDENGLTATAIYRGNPGWQHRAIGMAAVDVKWPLIGGFLGGNQVLTPRFQVVASPTLRNLAIPNEDARAIDLEDSNLFALNRFPGYDRVEDGVRFTYGFDWQWERPGWRVATTIGQSYRLTNRPTLLPDGTGLSSRLSDIVGRTEIRYKDFVKLTHRFRLDKDNFAVRRNEIDATIGNERTYAEVGYLRLNRNIATVEDLKDREELRVAGRVAFARYWSLFGSGVFNLTGKNEDPASTDDGFQALRTRLGVAYADDCLELAFTWRRDFVATGDARRGNTFQVSIAVRNLGFR
ncbi:LPS assembly protein LptD [Novosphingobium sp.]|uniref:LPS-assembly protein LptD n=1 Tax=Novosphingobium sp. TaxID=1874826 RepID=UPI0022C65E50|nr:LPS assembly protein LptD [Novosphingobium sp.]MCZ8019414.1 LPS assembly protein LptD [Novosphingobium sp.]MCZ8035229.1 LPS assembly protein LptD [Novosphingobium sp.]MCZ8050543.1 LPS assembly protein LptD [Novosphingobium sp.]MCZ8058889.1 LPS assembly protein LptD [Novosphingobium sp.]MCZ8232334.1 LPS assembly protein LptD [Novosphingobium sp.]